MPIVTSPPSGWEVLRSPCLYVYASVCLSVCTCSRIYQNACPNFTKFTAHVTVAVARSSSLLPILWITSCFHIMEPRSRIKNDSRFVELATRLRHWGEVAVYDCLVCCLCIKYKSLATAVMADCGAARAENNINFLSPTFHLQEERCANPDPI